MGTPSWRPHNSSCESSFSISRNLSWAFKRWQLAVPGQFFLHFENHFLWRQKTTIVGYGWWSQWNKYIQTIWIHLYHIVYELGLRKPHKVGRQLWKFVSVERTAAVLQGIYGLQGSFAPCVLAQSSPTANDHYKKKTTQENHGKSTCFVIKMSPKTSAKSHI